MIKFIDNAKNGAIISIVILIIALIILITVNIIPNENLNALSTVDKMMNYARDSKGETPMWKTVGYIIAGMLFVLYLIINFVMCRCHNCGRHIRYMNIFMMYCPYCSKSLETPKDK